MKLRPYQETCVKKMLWGITLDGNGIISVPTGGGKTHIIAEFTKRLEKPVLILVPSKELLEQDYDKLSKVVDADEIGIFSASMNSKEVKTYTLATIQSAYRKPELFAHYEVVLIDECDLLNPKKLDGMYNTFFDAIGNPRIIGLTATPFRMDSYYRKTEGSGYTNWFGKSYGDVETVHTLKFLSRYKEKFWKRVLHVVHVGELIDGGYLCPLTYHLETAISPDKLSFNKSKSEFDLVDFEEQFNPYLRSVADLIEELPSKSVLVFCATIAQAEALQEITPSSAIVTGKTKKKERTAMVGAFKSGELRVAINVGVLLIGFDKPDLEAIIVMRPTRSLRLHLQLLGRGMRTAEGKETCHVYDLVGNLKTLGRAETFKVEKVMGDTSKYPMWNVTSETRPDGWHYQELYTHRLSVKPIEEAVED